MSSPGEVTNDPPGNKTEATFATPLPPVLSNLSWFGIRLKNSQLVMLGFFFFFQGVVLVLLLIETVPDSIKGNQY